MLKDRPMDDRVFSNLVRDFRRGWLNQENYAERLALHRQPIVLKNETLCKLYDDCQAMQRRPEMRCADLDDKGISYVPSVIKEIRIRDKRIRSLYLAIIAFCQWSKADVVTTAAHMAEYKAIDQLIRRFQRETMRPAQESQQAKTIVEDALFSEGKKLEYNERESNSSFFRFAKEYEALKKQYRIEAPITREETEPHPRLIEGQMMSRNPEIPDDPGKALELFKNYYARVQFLYQKDYFYNKYRIWNEASVTAEIQAIESWMQEARKLSYSEVCERKDFTSEQHEFLRLENGYYEGYRMSWEQCNENSTAARVYGRYFHFLINLKEQLFDFIAARSNYRDANGNLIPERLARPEVQRRIEMETRTRIATLPLENQHDYYRAILNTNITRKRDYLASGETDKDRIALFDAEIGYANMELGRIERIRATNPAVPEKDNKPEPGSHPKPVFKEAVREQGFDILRHYFPADQQPDLQRILTTGEDAAEKLLFKGNGVTLLDFFKRLQTGQLVVSVSKSELQAWIIRNFTYGKESAPKAFRPVYAERVLSGSIEAVKGKRLIDVVREGGYWTIQQPAITNRTERQK